MSFQADLDSVQAQTSKTVSDFRSPAEEMGLCKRSETMTWLKQHIGLGHGHAIAARLPC